jgi:alpha-L-fucosidase
LIQKLVDIASKGGNYLLNVGPTAEGVIPRPSEERLEAMGAWLARNGESVYATRRGPLQGLSWARSTVSANDPSTVYLHVFEWPQGGQLRVPDFGRRVTGARLLGSSAPLGISRAGAETVIDGPAAARDADDTVVVLATAEA